MPDRAESAWSCNGISSLTAALLMLLMLPDMSLAATLEQRVAICDDEKAAPTARRTACTAIIDDPAAASRARADALVNRGDISGDEADYDRAIADFTAALALNPKDAAAHLLRGNAHDAKGDLDKALADYDAAVRLDPNDAAGYFNRGEIYQAKGDRQRAIADYQKAIKIDPSFVGAKEALAAATTAKP